MYAQQNNDEKPKDKDKKRHIRIGEGDMNDATAMKMTSAAAPPVLISLNDCLACRYVII